MPCWRTSGRHTERLRRRSEAVSLQRGEVGLTVCRQTVEVVRNDEDGTPARADWHLPRPGIRQHRLSQESAVGGPRRGTEVATSGPGWAAARR